MSNCPDCERPLKRNAISCVCGWQEKFSKPAYKPKCLKCGSEDIYKPVGLNWLCYEHTAKQHRSFPHNLFDYKLANPKCTMQEAWLHAMQFEKYKYSEEYYDAREKKKERVDEQALIDKLKPITFNELEDKEIA